MEDNIVASPIKTSCKDCCFATYSGKTQVGCELNQLEKFNKVEAYDNEKEFYVLSRTCYYHRSHNWKARVENPEQQVREELKLKTTLVILFGCSKKKSKIGYLDSIKKYLKETDRLKRVIILNNKSEISSSEIINWARKNLEISWKVCDIKDKIPNEKTEILIREILGHIETSHYLICENFAVDHEYIDHLSAVIEENLINKDHFYLIAKVNDRHGMFVAKDIHKFLIEEEYSDIYEQVDKVFPDKILKI